MTALPPETGNDIIDAALAKVAAAGEADLTEQAQRLDEAQAVLQEVLRTSRQAAQASSHER